MTIYFIYFKGSEEPYLYAITDKKKLLKKFKIQRNMDKFHVSEHEMDRDGFLEVCKNHSMYFLCERGIYTSSICNDRYVQGFIDLVITSKEDMEIVQSEDKFYMMLENRFTRTPIEAFNKELLIALNELGYFHVYKYSLTIHGFNTSFLEGINIEEPWLTFDQLNWFIETHDRTFR